MECGKERVGEIVKENARFEDKKLVCRETKEIIILTFSPEVLEKISNMLGMDDDDKDEDAA